MTHVTTRALQVPIHRLALIISGICIAIPVQAQISLTTVGTAYTQDFNGIGTSATATLPSGFKIDKQSSARTSGTYSAAGTATALAAGASMASNAGNGIYNFGDSATSSDRAVGFLASSNGTVTGNLYAAFTNNTGGTLSSFDIAYKVEKYRNGSSAAGFRYQLFYSTDGSTWTTAGSSFLTTFAADANTNGFTPAPASPTSAVSATLNLSVANGSTIYLDWQYSVGTGSSGASAVALGIDDISVTPKSSASSTAPTATGAATSVTAGSATTFSGTITPGANPTSSGYNVTCNLSSFSSGSSTFALTVTGTTISGTYTVPSNTTASTYSIPCSVADTESTPRSSNFNISLVVSSVSTPPTATGTASVNPVTAGNATTLSATATSGTNPTNNNLSETCNLTAIGGGSAVSLPVSYTVPSNTTATTYSISCTVRDTESTPRTSTFTISLTVNAPPPTTRLISEINGSGTTSPYAGSSVTTRGVVTGVRATTGSTKGFFIESVSADRDSDSNTSEGLLVFIGSASLPSCATVGNYISIQGTVQDFVPSTAPTGSVPLTELSSTSNCSVLGTPGVASLPSAVTITSSTLDPSGSATQAHKYQGMRVAMSNVVVVGPSTGTVTETDATSTVGFNFYVTASGVSRPFHTQAGIQGTRRPSDAASTVPTWNGNPEVLQIDASALTGGTNVAVATGTTISSISGIMDYDTGGGQYQIACGSGGIGTISPSSPTLSATANPAPLSTDLLVVDANIERFYNTVSNGGDVVLTSTAYQGRLSKLSLAVRNVMRMPDIIALEEVEGPTSGSSFPVLADIVAKINADASANSQGSPNYGYCGGVTNDPGLIAPAVIYRQDRVTQLECSQYGITTTYTLPYTTTPTTNTLNDRPPVVFRGRAKASGSDSSLDIRIVVNHLRSLNGIDQPGTANGDRVRTKRNEQAKYLGKLVSGNLGSEQSTNWTSTDNLLVAGDMNAFDINDGYSDSVNCIAGSPAPASQIYTTQAQQNASSPCTAISGLSLTNLTTTDTAQRYSYSFSGIAQRIDHVLVNSILNSRVRQVTYTRVNADFPEGPTYRNDFTRPERYSDHDAPAVYIKLPVEVTSRSRVNATALALNRATGRQIGTITVTNTGTSALTGPVYVFFTNLPAGVTLPDLPQSNGIPYATITLPSGLAPGATSAPATISFANPTNARVAYTPKIYDVNF